MTTNGNVNIELSRQTGSAAPISYAAANGPSTVTNAGPYAGTCFLHGDPLPSYLSPLALFKESGQFSVEYEIDRVRGIDTNKWDAFSFGTDAHFNYPHEAGTNGLEILLWEHGFYNIFINNTVGSNWELKNDQNVIQLAQYGWGANANLSSECIPLVSNCLYDAWTSGGLTLKGLNTNLQYIITLYSMGLDSGSRPSYLIPSDGDAITVVDQNEFGDRNGQILTYKYSPSADGIFSIATASDRGSNWVWYAFSNEIVAPEDPTSVSASQGTFSDKVRVSWNAGVGAESYTIYRADTNIFGFASVLTNNVTATTYDDESAALVYYYY